MVVEDFRFLNLALLVLLKSELSHRGWRIQYIVENFSPVPVVVYCLIFRWWRRPSPSWIDAYHRSSPSWIDGPGLHLRIKENTSIPAPRRDLRESAWAHNQVRSTTCGVFGTANYWVKCERLKRNIMSLSLDYLTRSLKFEIVCCKHRKTWGYCLGILICSPSLLHVNIRICVAKKWK